MTPRVPSAWKKADLSAVPVAEIVSVALSAISPALLPEALRKLPCKTSIFLALMAILPAGITGTDLTKPLLSVMKSSSE